MSTSRDEKIRKWTAQCYYENWKGEKKHNKEALEWEREFLKSTSANMDMMLELDCREGVRCSWSA